MQCLQGIPDVTKSHSRLYITEARSVLSGTFASGGLYKCGFHEGSFLISRQNQMLWALIETLSMSITTKGFIPV